MAKLFSRYNAAIRQRAVLDAWDSLTSAFVPVPVHRHIDSPVLAAATFVQNTSYPIYTAPNDLRTYKIVAISYRFTTQATGAATFALEVAGAAVAPGSGVAQTGSLSLQGTANTTINGTLTTQTVFGAGSSINLVVTNDAATTGLVGLAVTLVLARVT